jgi:hypothetical protein
VTPESGWETTALRFALRAPADPGPADGTARVFLEVPDGGPYPPFSLRVTEEGYAVVETDGLAEAGLGTSTLPLALVVVPREPVEPLSVRVTATVRSPEDIVAEASVADGLVMRFGDGDREPGLARDSRPSPDAVYRWPVEPRAGAPRASPSRNRSGRRETRRVAAHVVESVPGRRGPERRRRGQPVPAGGPPDSGLAGAGSPGAD